jgi:hypothetical protein
MTRYRNVGLVAPSAALALAFVLMLPSSAEAGRIKKRAGTQQDRIARGVKSGELTARETGRLERKESALNHEVKDMKALNGGSLTNKDKAIVNHQQNEISRGIYSQKHDAQTQNTAPKTEVGQRKENQQDRIGQGVASGELTPAEAGRLEGKETALNQETRDMRRLDGGKLTPGDKKVLNQQQDRLSKQIYGQKHDDQTQPD